MKIVILLYPELTVLDAIGPYEVLAQIPGVEVIFAAKEEGPVMADTGFLTLIASHALSDLESCDILLVPGGGGSKQAKKDPEILDFIRKMHTETKYTTSVCNGSLILGAAGLLDGLTATTYWADEKELPAYGAQYKLARWVEEGKIITAGGVSSGIDMALMLVSRLKGDNMAKMIQLGIEYDPNPPFDCGSVPKANPEHVKKLLHYMGRSSDAA